MLKNESKFDKKYIQIINEMAGTFKEQPNLVSYLNKCQNGYQFKGKQLKQILQKDQNINNIILEKMNSLKILKFDSLLSDSKIKNQISNLMMNKFQNIKEFNLWLNEFITQVKTTKGAFQQYSPENFVLFFNTNMFNRTSAKEIYHQITHFFQKYQPIHQIKSKKINKNHISTLYKHHIINKANIHYLQYLLNKNQIIPHINDLCYSLKKLKNENKKYKDLKNSQFINLLFETLNKDYPMQEQFCIDLMESSLQQSQLITFYLTYYLNIQFKRIKNIILDDFKD